MESRELAHDWKRVYKDDFMFHFFMKYAIKDIQKLKKIKQEDREMYEYLIKN